MTTNTITKTLKGFERYDGAATYVYDVAGKYLGQFQMDCLSETPDAGELFLHTFPGDSCYHELSAEQIQTAE